jgi:hypothetical protein
VQVSEPVERPQALASLLHEKLDEDTALKLGQTRALRIDNGSEAYGFDFAVEGEARGRVAVIEVGEQIVLVVASWPENADPEVVEAIDGMVRSVRMPREADPVMLRPDKA